MSTLFQFRKCCRCGETFPMPHDEAYCPTCLDKTVAEMWAVTFCLLGGIAGLALLFAW